mgnify:CR=1 FL=1
MFTQESLQTLATPYTAAIEIIGQRKTQPKPCNDDGFIAVKALSGLDVLYVLDPIKGGENFIVSGSALKAVKRKKVYKVDVFVTKTEAGDYATHTIPHRSKNSWVLSFKELLKAAEQGPVAMERDSDAEIYVPVTCTVDHIDELTQTEIDEALNDTFGDYVIDDLNHPALEGLLKAKPKKVVVVPIKKAPVAQSTSKVPVVVAVDDDSAELELDMSLFDEDGIEMGNDELAEQGVEGDTDLDDGEVRDLEIDIDGLALDVLDAE